MIRGIRDQTQSISSGCCRKGSSASEGAVVLNINAAAFVPHGVATVTPADATHLQFGNLPDSLNPSPLMSTHSHHEWPGKIANGYPHPLSGENSGPNDQVWYLSM
jgi:hypothetical protein